MSVRNCKALAVGAALLLVGACTNLTVEPKSTVTEANIFNDPASYRSFIAKAYAGLAVGGQDGGDGRTDIQGIDGGFSQYLRLYWEHQELPSDEAIIAWGDDGLPALIQSTWSSTNPFVNAMYYRVYFQVGIANEFLRQTTDEKLASRGQTSAALKAEVATYRAEARFLRALSYWHGIDLFGNIPLVKETDALGATPPPQATRAQVYDFIVSELTAIQGSLPAPGPTSYGRATGPAASMLLAHVYLNAGVYTGTTNYAGALAAAQAAIAGPYTLDPSYIHMFQADNNTSPELIYAVPEDGLKTQTYGSTNFLIHASCGGNVNPANFGVDGCWYGLRMKPETYNRATGVTADHPAGDNRTSYFFSSGQTVAVTSIGNFNNGILAPKFTNKTSTGATGSHTGFVDTDFPIFRLADAYLIYAEAVLRGGGGSAGQALTYVNALRQRAYGNTSGNITAGQLTLQFILDERGRELLWEGQRRMDLIRFGVFTGGTYLWAWKGGQLAGTATDTHLNLFPIPANELAANPNMHQNPGY
ncbi:MAG TPA: RagB/SusD family nutrient uptake outer membrane protein [Gemmatimonadales bacterium]|nr:RagB/SusD family nutrient uptake outer membrane protein [Gemmatimonadales bacterium]